MKNQSVSDFVAATMDAVLNSKEHKSLFASQYKKAGESMCAKHGKMDSCAADDQEAKSKKSKDSDSSSASDMNDARKKKEKDSDDDSCMADDQEDFDTSKDSAHSTAGRDRGEYDSHFADDDDNDARKKKKESDSSDESDADDNFDDDKDASKPVASGPQGSHVVFTQPAQIHATPPVQQADDGFETSAAFDVAIDSLLTASAALDSVGLGRGSALTLKIASLVVEAKKKEKKSKDSKKSSKDSKKSSKDSQSAKDKKSKDSKKSSKDSQSAKDKKSDKKSDSKSSKDSKKSSK